MAEKVSVAICTYNGESFIEEQLHSILNQTRQVDEIIICDDGSNDRTIEILINFSNKNPGLFKIFQNPINLRSVKNFEKAIQLCSGNLIFLSDQDDKWVDTKVSDFLEHFEKHKNLQVLCSNGYCINDNSAVLDKYTIWDGPKFLKEQNIDFTFYNLISYMSNIATGATMALRKEILPEVLPFPNVENFHHDEWIALISAKKGAFDMLDKKLIYYRIHENQQVGGISFDKSEVYRQRIIEVFDYGNPNQGFVTLKRRLRILSESYLKNKKIFENSILYQDYFEDNMITIRNMFNETHKILKRKFLLRSIILNISDKILNKRQLHK